MTRICLSCRHNQHLAPSRNLLDHNGVELYLNNLKTAGLEPTLGDLERCQPAGRSKPDSPQYEGQFEALVDRISRSFSKKQLRMFCAMYGLDSRYRLQKRKLVLAIIEQQWKWPSLDEIKRRKIEETKIEHICALLSLSAWIQCNFEM